MTSPVAPFKSPIWPMVWHSLDTRFGYQKLVVGRKALPRQPVWTSIGGFFIPDSCRHRSAPVMQSPVSWLRLYTQRHTDGCMSHNVSNLYNMSSLYYYVSRPRIMSTPQAQSHSPPAVRPVFSNRHGCVVVQQTLHWRHVYRTRAGAYQFRHHDLQGVG